MDARRDAAVTANDANVSTNDAKRLGERLGERVFFRVGPSRVFFRVGTSPRAFASFAPRASRSRV